MDFICENEHLFIAFHRKNPKKKSEERNVNTNKQTVQNEQRQTEWQTLIQREKKSVRKTLSRKFIQR